MQGRLRDPVLREVRTRRLSYCPRDRHRPPDHMPPAFTHRSSSEGKEPGCASLAQPARIESTHSPPVMCESPGLASSRLIVSPLGCRRQSEACRTQFVALGLFLVRGRDDRDGATTEPDAAMGERGTTAPLIRAEGAPS